MALVPFANSILRLDKHAREAVRGAGVRIGASSNIGMYILQPYLRAFRDDKASPDVDLVIDNNPSIARQLTIGELDIAIMEWWQPNPDFWRRIGGENRWY